MKDLIPAFVAKFQDVFPGLKEQKDFLTKVVEQEEKSFLRTLDSGIKLFNEETLNVFKQVAKQGSDLSEAFSKAIEPSLALSERMIELSKALSEKLEPVKQLEKSLRTLNGDFVFKLQDTYGFPKDLTALMAKEKGLEVDEAGFKAELQKQKDRSRADAKKESGDWIVLE